MLIKSVVRAIPTFVMGCFRCLQVFARILCVCMLNCGSGERSICIGFLEINCSPSR